MERVSINPLIRTVTRPPDGFTWAWALERPASEPLTVHVIPALTMTLKAPPRDDELVLWFGAPSTDNESSLLDFLSESERLRADRFRLKADRWAFTAAHAALRTLLGQMVGCPPLALRFVADAKGKPRIDGDTAVQFSITHTRECVAIAVAGCAIGIDIERRRAVPELMAVARTAFGPEGNAALAARSGWEAQTALFYRYWTLGEAFVKATGEGISQDLTSFAFTEQGAPALTRVSGPWGPVGRWRFYCEP